MGDAAGKLANSLHSLRLRQPTFTLAQSLFDVLAIADVVDHAGEGALAIGLEFAHRQVHRKRCSILASAADLAPNADDPFDAGLDVAGNVAVVLGGVRL